MDPKVIIVQSNSWDIFCEGGGSARDIISAFSNTVTKYSQIDCILNRLKAVSVDISSQIGFAGHILLNLLDEFDTDEIDVKKRRQIKFIGTQLLALVSNRYTPDFSLDRSIRKDLNCRAFCCVSRFRLKLV